MPGHFKVYLRHNQESSIDFIDCTIQKLPFRIHTVHSARVHKWQYKFHWHVQDKGIQHVYIKPQSPQLNDKVHWPQRTDQELFPRLLNLYGRRGSELEAAAL